MSLADNIAKFFKDFKTQGYSVSADYAHHEIHEGNHFFYSDSVTLASSGTQDYLITTADTSKLAHMIRILGGSAVTQFQLYEGSDKTGTTLQTTRNRYRDSAVASGVTIHKGTSGGTTDGTLISQYKGGSAQGASSNPTVFPSAAELVLKRNTKYILRVTSGTADNLTNVLFDWYEKNYVGDI